MKSIHFNQAPTMNGKLTTRFTDIVVENYKPKILKSLAHRQMKTRCEDFSETDGFLEVMDHAPCSWDCDICDWQEFIGGYRPHPHWID